MVYTNYFQPIIKVAESRLCFFLFSFLFLFYFPFIFHFSIFKTLGLGLEVICHTITSVISNSEITTLIMGLKRRKQKVLEQSDICYDLKLKVSSNKITLVLSNTRELNRVPSTKQSTLYTIIHGLCSLLYTLP